MNKKAKELGLTQTQFVTPHGLDEEAHYTTAYELAKITDYALNIKKFEEIVRTKSYTVTINKNPKNINNTNELLGYLNRSIRSKNRLHKRCKQMLSRIMQKRKYGHNLSCTRSRYKKRQNKR